jgi:hypothetical protein
MHLFYVDESYDEERVVRISAIVIGGIGPS